MAVRSTIPQRGLRALIVSASLALAAGSPGAHAQTVGPVANFGPTPIDLQAPTTAAPSRDGVQESRTDAQTPAIESRPLMAPRTTSAPAVLDGEAANPAQPSSWMRVLGALAIVIGLILIVRYAIKRVSAKGGLRGQLGAGGRAPSGVLEVLGRYPISRGQSLVLLRIDQRVLLLSQSGSGFRALANFDDPSDVASLLMKSRDDESASLSGRFKQMLGAFERDPSLTRDVEHVDLTRRAPLISRERSPMPHAGVQRVATPIEAQDAIRRRLASLREAAR